VCDKDDCEDFSKAEGGLCGIPCPPGCSLYYDVPWERYVRPTVFFIVSSPVGWVHLVGGGGADLQGGGPNIFFIWCTPI